MAGQPSTRRVDPESEVPISTRMASPSRTDLWEYVVETDNDELEFLSTHERAEVLFLREILRFAYFMEKFVASLVHAFSPQSSTSVVRLPDQDTWIREYVDALAEGSPKEIEGLRDHLVKVESWMVSTLSAYHEAPKVWFRRFWTRISPVTIESSFSEGGWKRKLGVKAVELWDRYKEIARVINPQLISDEIYQEVQRQTRAQYERLKMETKNRRREQ